MEFAKSKAFYWFILSSQKGEKTKKKKKKKHVETSSFNLSSFHPSPFFGENGLSKKKISSRIWSGLVGSVPEVESFMGAFIIFFIRPPILYPLGINNPAPPKKILKENFEVSPKRDNLHHPPHIGDAEFRYARFFF